MKAGGWVKIHRKLIENPVVMKDADHLALWLLILLCAVHEPRDVVFKGERRRLLPGQFTTGRKELAAKLKVSESKVQRILNYFKSEHQIEQEMSAECRLITVKNWHEYQKVEQQTEQEVNSYRTASEQQVNTNKEGKNERTEESTDVTVENSPVQETGAKKGKAGKTDEHAASIVQVLDAFRTSVNPTISFKNQTERDAARNLVKTHGIDQILKAIAFAASIRGQPYAPSIYKPSDLEKKWPNLINAKERLQRPSEEGQGSRSGVRKLHDGSEAVMFNGRWVDVNNRSIVIDLAYYPELTK